MALYFYPKVGLYNYICEFYFFNSYFKKERRSKWKILYFRDIKYIAVASDASMAEPSLQTPSKERSSFEFFASTLEICRKTSPRGVEGVFAHARVLRSCPHTFRMEAARAMGACLLVIFESGFCLLFWPSSKEGMMVSFQAFLLFILISKFIFEKRKEKKFPLLPLWASRSIPPS